jgi:hypothetical protein
VDYSPDEIAAVIAYFGREPRNADERAMMLSSPGAEAVVLALRWQQVKRHRPAAYRAPRHRRRRGG